MESMAIPLFRDTRYRGRVLVCNYNSFLFEYENNQYEMKLFNVMLNDVGNKSICAILTDNFIEIEIDKLASTSEVIEVYAFVNDELLQVRLIEENMARLTLRNPEFKYYSEMMNSKSVEVNSETVIDGAMRDFDRMRANNFLFVNFWLIAMTLLFLGVRKKVKKSIK